MAQTRPASPARPLVGRSVSLTQAAALLQVSLRTVYNRIRDGYLQTVRTPMGSQRVLLDSLEALQALPRSAFRVEGQKAGGVGEAREAREARAVAGGSGASGRGAVAFGGRPGQGNRHSG